MSKPVHNPSAFERGVVGQPLTRPTGLPDSIGPFLCGVPDLAGFIQGGRVRVGILGYPRLSYPCRTGHLPQIQAAFEGVTRLWLFVP